MTKLAFTLPALLAATAITVAAAPWGEDGGNEIELDEAEVFIEFNSTDGDFGIQFFWDGEPWRKMNLESPDEEIIMRVKIDENLKEQGMTEGFFESAEPSVEELSMAEFLDRFPAGEYEYEGRTLDEIEIEGETELTHDLPSPPSNLSPGDDEVVAFDRPVILSFDAVTTTLDGDPIVPELYEIVLETEDEILKVLSVIIDGDEANPSLTVPPEFLEPGTEYKFEVIVQEESHNRTISETVFFTK